MNKLAVLGVVAACVPAPPTTAPPPPPAAIAVPGPAPVLVLEGEAAPGPGVTMPRSPPSSRSSPAAHLDQPASVKLKLGHYRNARRGIGVTIDLSEQTESIAEIAPAKVRFDGESRVWRLEGQHGSFGRIDYVRDGGRVMLHVWKNGEMAVYVPDPDDKPSSEEVYVVRDGDAEPL